MDKIVLTGMKIDLHIHSHNSSSKDGSKVKNNTKENLHVLKSKLNENGVNICSITDHDTFSYEMYSILKVAENENNSIKKVLPGVEFSVLFKQADLEKEIHVVAIFSDSNDAKVRNIEVILKANPPTNMSYSEEQFIELLRKIELDTILIAHQKNSLSSSTPREKDANSLGEEKFFEFIETDYFEAFEFKNKRNEIMNKAFLEKNCLQNNVHFVTGSDCHDWNVYPKEDMTDKSVNFPFTYIKSLPTFKGLVMAITEQRRLNHVNNFFNVNDKIIENINITIDGKKIVIPLSKGINVIIGDNSIGKSMLLHALTKYKKDGDTLNSKVKNGYISYLEKHKMSIETHITKNDIFQFDMQGEVRSRFESNKLGNSDFLSRFFPSNVISSPYRQIVDSEIQRMIDYLQKKFTFDDAVNKLSSFNLLILDEQAESLTFISNLKKSKKSTENLDKIHPKIEMIINELKELNKLEIDESDHEYINNSLIKFSEMKVKYQEQSRLLVIENEKVEKVANIIQKISTKHQRSISDKQKQRGQFENNVANLKIGIIDILQKYSELKSFVPDIETTQIIPNVNKLFDYKFISKLNIDKIDNAYFEKLISDLFRKNESINWGSITKNELENMAKKNKYDGQVPILSFIKAELSQKLDVDFSSKLSIVKEDDDVYQELSSGMDSKIYFDIIAYENQSPGLYIIDQPEDNISQSSIKTLLERFKTMSDNRQVLMVTHNPQFIVNLDIDNLIFITKVNNNIEIKSGALEYVDDRYSILEIVAENIDGGLDTIKRRWKRYEKNLEI